MRVAAWGRRIDRRRTESIAQSRHTHTHLPIEFFRRRRYGSILGSSPCSDNNNNNRKNKDLPPIDGWLNFAVDYFAVVLSAPMDEISRRCFQQSRPEWGVRYWPPPSPVHALERRVAKSLSKVQHPGREADQHKKEPRNKEKIFPIRKYLCSSERPLFTAHLYFSFRLFLTGGCTAASDLCWPILCCM